MGYYDRCSVETLKGKTLTKIDKSDDEIRFHCNDGTEYLMYHDQDCCESVTVEDIAGDLDDLVGSPIIDAREESNTTDPPDVTKEYQDSFTWTFYIITTVKGSVTIRWYGTSSGYYSESVDFKKIG